MKDYTLEQLANDINRISAELVIEHLGGHPGTWYTGGEAHNDDRLVAEVEGDTVYVSNGSGQSEYVNLRHIPDEDGAREYVEEWLDNVWSEP